MVRHIPDRPRISCSTGTLTFMPLARALGIIRDAGFDGAELIVGPDILYRSPTALQRILKAADLTIFSYHPPLLPLPGWPRRQIDAMLAVVQGAETARAGVAVIHAPRSYTMTTPRARDYVRGMEIAATFAARHGIIIGLETTQKPLKKRPRLFDDLAYFMRFATEHDLGVTLDTCHAGANRDHLDQVLADIGTRLYNIHLSDCRIRDADQKPQTHLRLGTGNTVDLGAFLRTLAYRQYTGVITLEISPFEAGVLSERQILARLIQERTFIEEALATGMGLEIESALPTEQE